MKVLLINGSARPKGNTQRALEEVAGALNDAGVETEIAWIGAKAIHGCTACGTCGRRGDNKCVFADDVCNELIQKAGEADGLIIGSPVYYAGMNGSLVSLLDRMFYAGGSLFRFKPAAGIAVARRAGTTLTADQIDKYFQINCMPLVSSTYWLVAHGREPGQTCADAEGMYTMRTLGTNMAWLLKCIEAGKAAGIPAPKLEPNKPWTHFVREDLLA